MSKQFSSTFLQALYLKGRFDYPIFTTSRIDFQSCPPTVSNAPAGKDSISEALGKLTLPGILARDISGVDLPLNDQERQQFILQHGGFQKAHEFACDHVTKEHFNLKRGRKVRREKQVISMHK